MGWMGTKPPRICVISTGGTISVNAGSKTEFTGYSSEGRTNGRLDSDQLIQMIPGIEMYADIMAKTAFAVPSSAIGEKELLALGRIVNETLKQPDIDGVVVTHGTDSMEETAFFLHMTVKSEKPVIITGSMFPSSVLSADGPVNLYDAVLAAADPQSWGMGVIVCMCGRLFCARDIVKTSTFRLDAFKAMEYGALGNVVGSEVHYYYKPVRSHTVDTEFELQNIKSLPKVEIIYTYQGCSEVLLKAAVESGAAGIVCAGMGSGAIPPDLRNYYKSLDKKPFLVRGTRAYSGYTARHSATPDDEFHTIPAGDLTVLKARILLQLGLTVTDDYESLKAIFQKY